ncbi:DUF6578 domain-containing protein [Streptomyces sp. NPDC002928]|uniref:DUF6578 domain-containing protein n=1 Tax=Streptomyces sp. NPDC002928 TaxID=3154440 RepID=UPI0033A40B83
MGLWHVFYADWQMECCGTPFAVGEEVSWPLLLTDADDFLGGGWDERLTHVVGPVREVSDGEGTVRVVGEDEGLIVALGDAGPREARQGDRIRAAGLLTVERHGGSWPETTGRVRAVQVLTQGFAESAPGSRSWWPVPGERSLRPVRSCPKWFADGDVRTGADGRGRRRSEEGAVVTLEVFDVPPAPSETPGTVSGADTAGTPRTVSGADTADAGGQPS